MVKTAQWEKRELLNMLNRNRKDERCIMVRKLQNDAKELTKSINDEMHIHNTKLNKLITDKENILKIHKLGIFEKSGTYSCNIMDLHPTLITFDNETDQLIANILQG